MMTHSRRDAVKLSLLAAGGLIVACKTMGNRVSQLSGDDPGAAPGGTPLTGWVQITPDGKVRYVMPWTESGQGIATGLAALVGEELDVDPLQIAVVFAGGNDLLPDNDEYAPSATGGSSSVTSSFTPLRKAAAAAREMLIAAAAADWSVQASECRVQNGSVVHQGSGKTATFGSLATKAAAVPVPGSPTLKAPPYKYIGQPVRRLDLRGKVDGSAVFGIDVKLPNMVNATIVHSPYVGGRAQTVDDAQAKAAPGVIAVVQTPYGVAVVADTFWHALSASKLLNITWQKGQAVDSDAVLTAQKALVEQPAMQAEANGDFAQAFAGAAKKVEAYYQVPYLPHSTLEPQNATARLNPDGTCEIWAPTQDPVSGRDLAAQILGLDKSKVKVHVTLAGGAFGRRLRQDYIGEVAHIVKAVQRPVKLLWSRAEEFQQDFYRPASYNKLQAGLDQSGNPVAWLHRIAGSSIYSWLAEEPNIQPQTQSSPDGSSVEGATRLVYDIANTRVEWAQHECGVPVSWWRSVGYSQNTWVVESFLDECAAAAGKDPLAYRLALAKDPRVKAVLQQAATAAGWGQPLAQGTGRGIAVAACFGSVVAQVAEVQVSEGNLVVKKVTAAVDCGTAVNPFLVKTQIQSAIVQALGAALHQQMTFKDGMVQQRNFTASPLLTLSEMPDVQVVVVDSGAAIGGIGEPGVPPLAPAVCNAIFAANGQRIRKLPIKL